MRLSVRPIAMLSAMALALVCTACGGSNNKGKIEGKWKVTEMPSKDQKDKDGLEMMDKLGLYVYFEFKNDGVVSMGLGSDKPEALEFVKAMSKGSAMNFSAKYKLLSKEAVEFSDLPKEMQEKGGVFGNKDKGKMNIKIDGDSMTMTDDADKNKSMKLTKLK